MPTAIDRVVDEALELPADERIGLVDLDSGTPQPSYASRYRQDVGRRGRETGRPDRPGGGRDDPRRGGVCQDPAEVCLMRFYFHPLANTELDEAIRYYEECDLVLE